MVEQGKLGTCDLWNSLGSDYLVDPHRTLHVKSANCVNWREQPEQQQHKYTFDDYCDKCASTAECAKRGRCLGEQPAGKLGTCPTCGSDRRDYFIWDQHKGGCTSPGMCDPWHDWREQPAGEPHRDEWPTS